MSVPPPRAIRVDRASDGVRIVTIDREESFNTLSAETLEELDAVVRAIESDVSVSCVVLTGAGGTSFAAGADIREVGALSSSEAIAFAARGQRVFDRVERAPQFYLAAIDGYCMGGGLDLALACDARHASERSVFAHPGARLGILTGFGGTSRLPRLVGRARAIELFATCRRISAHEALQIGLVDRVADDAFVTALESADRIEARWPVATQSLKADVVSWWRRRPSRA